MPKAKLGGVLVILTVLLIVSWGTLWLTSTRALSHAWDLEAGTPNLEGIWVSRFSAFDSFAYALRQGKYAAIIPNPLAAPPSQIVTAALKLTRQELGPDPDSPTGARAQSQYLRGVFSPLSVIAPIGLLVSMIAVAWIAHSNGLLTRTKARQPVPSQEGK